MLVHLELLRTQTGSGGKPDPARTTPRRHRARYHRAYARMRM